MKENYEAVIGLEVHAELRTESKLFCSCSTAFGAAPNSQCCPICLGHPGCMPQLNRHAVELAIRAGLALGCEIAPLSRFDRKQYFYPDLPKAYQISQDAEPLCRNGGVLLPDDGEGERHVEITRIHLEEDAGKLIHRDGKTLIDCNRCGVPLIEIVTAPVLRSASEAVAYLRTLRGILLTCGISDCRMQEGSLRCDVNLSLREVGSERMGVRTEIKNLNSFAFVEKAIAYEIGRQRAILESGEMPLSETRRFDEASGKNLPMRGKERAIDYRFMPEPDLLPIRLSSEEVESIRAALPELPSARAMRLEREYAIKREDARLLVQDPALADFFESAAGQTQYPRLSANLILNDLQRICRNDPFVSPISPDRLAALAELQGAGEINSATLKKLLSRLASHDFDPRVIAREEGLTQITSKEALQKIVQAVLEEHPQAVSDYRSGKTAAIKALLGKAMAKSGGRAEPRLLESIFLANLCNR